jgi:hypothetical protein
MSTPPPHAEFTAAVRHNFSFLERFGFRELAPPPHRARDPFQIWFAAGNRFVIVAGEGYGTRASVTLEHEGRELPAIYLVPVEERRPPAKEQPRDQVEQIRDLAMQLEKYGRDFVEGDLTRFSAKAKPLPPYKNIPDNRSS